MLRSALSGVVPSGSVIRGLGQAPGGSQIRPERGGGELPAPEVPGTGVVDTAGRVPMLGLARSSSPEGRC